MQQLVSVAELADLVADRASRDRPPYRRLVVGLAGPPGVGKSTTAEKLVRLLGERNVVASLLPMDGYHRSNARLEADRSRDRKGAPDTFDAAAFIRALTSARTGAGKEQRFAGFDRDLDEPIARSVTIAATAEVLITEGNYLLLPNEPWSPVRSLLDLAVALTLENEKRVRRLVARHVSFGMDPEQALAWATGPDESNRPSIAAAAGRADYSLDLS